jgi:hypothetical protein
MDRLADAWTRLRWGNRDAAEFHAICRSFEESDAYAVQVDRDGEIWTATWRKLIDPDEEGANFDELARLVGSFLDHGRAALNYAAYQLACHALEQDPSLHGTLRPWSIEFPIFNERRRYRDDNRLKQLPEGYRAPIEQLQPYHGASSGLWLLQKLSAAFRHNVIHVATIYLLESIYHLQIDGEPQFPNVLEIIPHEQIEDGDLLMRFKLETQGKNVRPAVPIHIGIDHPLCENRDGVAVLNEIARDVQIAVDTVDRLIHT